MEDRVDLVIVGAGDRRAFDEELAGRAPHPRVRVVDLGAEPAPRIAPNEHALSTVALDGAEQVSPAEAAAAALTGRRSDPAETRAPGRPRAV